jgi:hypothetical protein
VATKVSYDQSAMHMAALVILLDRVGGSLTFTEAEYQAIVAPRRQDDDGRPCRRDKARGCREAR